MEKVPEEYFCPITGEIMRDPVINSASQTYERSAIENWYKTHDTDPITGEKVENKMLISNLSAKSMIRKL